MFPDVLGIGNRAGIKHPLILEYVTKKLVRNFEGQNESIFRKLRGLNAEVVSYKKNECISLSLNLVLKCLISANDIFDM